MINTNKLLEDNNIVDVIGNHIHLNKKGSEYIGVCPFHEDEKASLQVNPKKQIFKCFACGGPDGKGGDAIHFLMGLGATFNEACDELSGGSTEYKISPEKRQPKKQIEPEWKHVWPIKDVPSKIVHYKFGKPSQTWNYYHDDGGLIGVVCRFDLDDGTKQVLPYCCATNGDITKFMFLGFEKPRSLYNLHLIKQNTKATILIVEGEKTADAAQNELDPSKTVVTTWIGGANGIVNANFKPLYSRKIIYWPDNDTEQKYGDKHQKAGEIKPWNEQPGNHAMLQIHEILSEKCQIHRWVKVPNEFPHKWDAADKEWNAGELREFVKNNFTDVPKVEIVKKIENPKILKLPVKKVVETKITETAPAKTIVKSNPDENEHFKMLGYDKDENGRLVYYFFSFEAKTTIKLTPPSMNKSNLMMIAPINWWEDKFPGAKSKIDIDSCQQFLMAHSHRIGMFKEKFIRGRGAWVDDGRFVIHTGDELIVNEQKMHLRGIRSQYVYELGEKMGLGSDVMLPKIEAAKLIEKMKWLKWEREINSYLIAGWCVIAPFCGILKWRPHVWVTGPAGSGKSWTMENVIKRLLGESAIVVQGKTTEAGVRGLVQNDARAVLFDESDVESHNDKERIQNILALARSSSYSDGGVIGKGTQTGQSRTYTMRSCFAFSSIGVQLNQQSDRSRFTMLGLQSFEKFRTSEDFEKFEFEWHKLITEDYVHQLQARTIHLLPVILKNSKTFSDAASHVIGQRRIGEQVGGMLAGAYSLISDNEISYEDAVNWVKAKDWTEEKGLELTKDEYQLFTTIMGYQIKIESSYGILERTIGESILIASNKINEPQITPDSATKKLRRIGIIVTNDEIWLSNTADGIKNIIRNTSWAHNHNKILERLPDSGKIEPRVFYPGCKSRGISLPISMITDGIESFHVDSTIGQPLTDDDLPF
ncbi:MAG: hypothetical protein JKY43_03190 [Phycisphaerales bacterium]|nr:hypothetical protein [Phycisphaerales bacterium]